MTHSHAAARLSMRRSPLRIALLSSPLCLWVNHVEARTISAAKIVTLPPMTLSELVSGEFRQGNELAESDFENLRPDSSFWQIAESHEQINEGTIQIKARRQLANGKILGGQTSLSSAKKSQDINTTHEVKLSSNILVRRVEQASVKAKPKGVPETHSHSLELRERGGHLSYQPRILDLPEIGLTVGLNAKLKSKLQVFVRNESVLHWNHTKQELKALAAGETELFLVYNEKMHILPVKVAMETEQLLADLQVPEDFYSLHDKAQPPVSAQAGAPSGSHAPPLAEVALSPSEDLAMVTDEMSASPSQAIFGRQLKDSEFQTLVVQIIDERSDPAISRIFPAIGVELKILGTEKTYVSDGEGKVSLWNVPRNSRYLMSIQDPKGVYANTISQLSTYGNGDIKLQKVMRRFSLENYAFMARTAQRADLASFCATILDETTGSVGKISVNIDVEADGPYYFNSYGYFDPGLQMTGPNGRMCFFNVLPGPATLTISTDSETAIPIGLHAGVHTERDLYLNPQPGFFRTQLVALPTAQEQLDVDAKATFRRVDSVPLYPFGSSEPIPSLDEGLLESDYSVSSIQGRQYAVVDGSAFETTLYGYHSFSRETPLTPLIPRGFVEDMSVLGAVVYDPLLGVVIVDHGLMRGQSDSDIGIRLVDGSGFDIGEGRYFSSQDATKAIFFNIPAGLYSVQIEQSDGRWIAGETVFVYDETVSYVQTGSLLRYRGVDQTLN